MSSASELRRLVNSYQLSQAIHVAAVLGIADLLTDGPRSSDELATATETNPGALYRLLRALAAFGLFHEENNGRFTLTELGDALRADAPESVAGWAAFVGRRNIRDAWSSLEESIRTGELRAGSRLLISRKIDANFPAYERVIPKTNDKRIEFDRDRLVSAVRRVRLLSNERSKAVKFVMGKDQVEITSSTPEVGEAHEVLPVDYSGDAMQICFNADYVDNFLGVVETDSVLLEFKDEMSQAVMKPIGAEGYEYTYVIMPMRI